MKDDLGSIMITKHTPERYIQKLAQECRKCGHCCLHDSGIFLEDDIERISKFMGVPIEEFKARFLEEKEIYNKRVWKAKLKRQGKPFGPCLFLNDDNKCDIHEVKPKHCKVASGCGEYGQQLNLWFMLNYVLEPSDPEAIRQWATYLRTHPTIPGGELHELIPDKDELGKILSYERLK